MYLTLLSIFAAAQLAVAGPAPIQRDTTGIEFQFTYWNGTNSDFVPLQTLNTWNTINSAGPVDSITIKRDAGSSNKPYDCRFADTRWDLVVEGTIDKDEVTLHVTRDHDLPVAHATCDSSN